MQRLIQAGFYSALFTMYGGSLYFLFSMAMTLAQGGDIAKAFVDTLLGCIVCWVFGTFVFYEINKAFDEFNKAGRRPDDKNDPNDTDKKDCQ
jgi:uncharacterized membrane protein YccC